MLWRNRMLYCAPGGCPPTGWVAGFGNPGRSLTVNVTEIGCDMVRWTLVEMTEMVPVYVPGTRPLPLAKMSTSPNAAALVEPLGVALSHGRSDDVRHVMGIVLMFRTATGELV